MSGKGCKKFLQKLCLHSTYLVRIYLETNLMTLGVKEGGGKSDNNPSVAYNNNIHGVWYTMVLMKGTYNQALYQIGSQVFTPFWGEVQLFFIQYTDSFVFQSGKATNIFFVK